MTGADYDWTAFASGFGVALLLALLLRWRKGRRVDLTKPTDAVVNVPACGGHST